MRSIALLPLCTLALSLPRRSEIAPPSLNGALAALQNQGRKITHLSWFDDARAIAVSTMRVPSYALAHVYDSGIQLSRSLPSNRGEGQDEVLNNRRAWMGFAAGGICELASAGMAGLCASFACAELAVRSAKVASGVLAAQLAEGARFGGLVARRELEGQGPRDVASAMAKAGAHAAMAEPIDEHHAREHAPPPAADDEYDDNHDDYHHHHHHEHPPHHHSDPHHSDEGRRREEPEHDDAKERDYDDDGEPHETGPRAVDTLPLPPPKWRSCSSTVVWT